MKSRPHAVAATKPDRNRLSGHLRPLARDTLLYGLSAVLARGLNLLIVPLYVRYLDPVDFGTAALIIVSVQLLSLISELGLSDAAGRWYSLAPDDDLRDRRTTFATAAWAQVILAVGLLIATIGLAGPIASTTTGHAGAAGYLRLAALAVPLAALGNILRTWLRFQRRPLTSLVISLSTAVLTLGLSFVTIVVLDWGVWGLFSATTLAQAFGAATSIVLMPRWLDPRLVNWRRARSMLAFGLPWVPGMLAIWLIDLSDRIVIRLFWPVSEVAKYQLAYTISAASSLFVQAVQPAWIPYVLSIKDRSESRETYAQLFSVYLSIGLGLAIAVAAFSPWFVWIVAPPFYTSAATVVGLLAVSHVMVGSRTIGYTGAFLGGRQLGPAIAVILAAILNVGLNFALVPSLGIVGAAAATLGAQILAAWLTFRASQAQYAIPYRQLQAAFLIALATVLAIVSSELASASLPAATSLSVIALTIFAIAAVSLGAVPRPSRRALPKSWK